MFDTIIVESIIGGISFIITGYVIIHCCHTIRKKTNNDGDEIISVIEEKLKAKSNLIGLINQFKLGYSDTASQCKLLPSFRPGQFNHIKVINFYEELIEHIDKSSYDNLIVELFKYHLDEQLFVLQDDKISFEDKQIIISKNFTSFNNAMSKVISLDEEMANTKSNEEKEYLMTRALKHNDLMDKIAKDIESNQYIFTKEYKN